METSVRNQPSQMIETLHKGVDIKRNLEKLSPQLQIQTKEVGPQPKKHKTQLVLEQVHVQQDPSADPQEILQQVPREEQSVPLVQLAPPEQVLM